MVSKRRPRPLNKEQAEKQTWERIRPGDAGYFQVKLLGITHRMSRLPGLGPLAGSRRLNTRASPNLVMVLGCQRSGTTLAFLMLTAHPRLVGLDELDSRGALPTWPALLTNAAAGRKTVFKLPTRTIEADRIAGNFRHARLVWMVRHPLAVVSSMRRLDGEHGRNWIQSYARSELEYARRYFSQMGSLDHMSEIELAASVWRYKNEALDLFRDRGLEPLIVRYEDLLSAPREAMTEVLEYLGAPWDERVLEHWKHHGQRTMIGGTRTDAPIDRSRLDPELALSPEEQQQVINTCRPLLARFGYDLGE